MATAGDRRETDSGIELKPVYAQEDVAGRVLGELDSLVRTRLSPTDLDRLKATLKGVMSL